MIVEEGYGTMMDRGRDYHSTKDAVRHCGYWAKCTYMELDTHLP